MKTKKEALLDADRRLEDASLLLKHLELSGSPEAIANAAIQAARYQERATTWSLAIQLIQEIDVGGSAPP
jgi:uncharacterized protein with PhoU and TrkA domain